MDPIGESGLIKGVINQRHLPYIGNIITARDKIAVPLIVNKQVELYFDGIVLGQGIEVQLKTVVVEVAEHMAVVKGEDL